MENGSKKLVLEEKKEEEEQSLTVRDVLGKLMENINEGEKRATIPLGHGDPSVFPCFQTTPIAQDAIVNALQSSQFNCYAPAAGILPARRYLHFPSLAFIYFICLFSVCCAKER